MGREVGRRGFRGIMIGTHGVGVNCGDDSVAQRRQIVTLWHLTILMGSDCNGACGGHDNRSECSNHIVFSCETFIRVYINNTLKKKLFLIFLMPVR